VKPAHATVLLGDLLLVPLTCAFAQATIQGGRTPSAPCIACIRNNSICGDPD
jgi:hypothetical protein